MTLFQDPNLPAGVSNADIENEPTFICNCDTCGEELYKGDWIYKIGSHTVCDDVECVLRKVAIRDYALEFCLADGNIKDFVDFIDLSGWLLHHQDARLKDMLINDDGESLPVMFCRHERADFVDWLVKEDYIQNDTIRDCK